MHVLSRVEGLRSVRAFAQALLRSRFSTLMGEGAGEQGPGDMRSLKQQQQQQAVSADFKCYRHDSELQTAVKRK